MIGYLIFAGGYIVGVLHVISVRAWRAYQAEKRGQ